MSKFVTTLTPSCVPLLTVHNVFTRFAEQVVLNNVSFKLQRGEIMTLIGPNGAGKSTLVKVVLGLLTPQQGSIQYSPQVRIGYMPQRVQIDPILPLTVKRFLLLSRWASQENIPAILAEVGGEHLLKRPLHHLSGGELQRVLLARTLLGNPDLLVLDEPIQGVDVVGQCELYELIAQIRQTRQCGILLVSHDLHLVMAATDSVICLNQSVHCYGKPEAVVKHPAYAALFGQRAAQGLAIYAHHPIK